MLTKTQKGIVEKIKRYEESFGEILFVFYDDNKWCMGTHSKRFAFGLHGNTLKSLCNKNILVNRQWGESSLQSSLSLSDVFR